MTRGPRPTGHTPWVPDPGCGKSEPPHAPVLRLLGAATEDRRYFFKTKCSGIEAPRAWPDETTRHGGRGSVSRGDKYGSWRDRRRISSEYVSRRTELAHQSSFGPTCRLTSSPKVGLGATVGTLKLGYPLLQYEDVVPTRLSLVAW
jgi:hypothetical protein